MNVTMLAKETALTKIFQQAGMNHENSHIGLAELKAEWAKTGLRMSDLAEVLASLMERGVLKRDTYDEAGLVLTADGVSYLAQSKLTLPNVVAYTSALLTLRRIGKRTRRSTRAGRDAGRRAGDVAAA